MIEDWEGFAAALGAVIEYGAGLPTAEETMEARKAFLARVGEPFGDEPLYERRNTAFLEWLVFDRPLRSTGRTPAEETLHRANAGAPADAVRFAGPLRANQVLMGNIERVGQGSLRIRRWANDEKFDVVVGTTAGLERKSVIMLRVFGIDGRRFAAPSAEVLAPEYRRPLRKALKAQRKAGDDEGLWTAGLRLMLLRQRYAVATRDEVLDRWQRMFLNPMEASLAATH